FSSVTSVLNMSVFQDQFVLEDLIEEVKKKSTALSFGPLQPNGHIYVEGSFPAIKLLRDFLLLKAKSLSEEDKREESKSHQRPWRREKQHSLPSEDADGEKQIVVLDTDVYRYMKSFFPSTFQVNDDVVISDTTDGDTTTVYLERAGGRPDAGQVLRVKEQIESQSVKLYSALRKERINIGKHTRGAEERYKMLCGHLQSHYPHLLVIPYDTHIDVIGKSSEILELKE
ncbi:RBM43 protein, partial [Galbula dea]|nr:RBM43 protein [Galbula dea]